MWLIELVLLNSANLICRSADISKYFRESLGIRDSRQSTVFFFHISAQNIVWFSLGPPRGGGSNKYPQSMFLSINKKNNVYPCKPVLLYKIGV